jgi:choline dehydrogenase-like flavoprotein
VIEDGRQVPHGSALETDVCIIGAGAAGITVARELAGSAHGVVVLESGGTNGSPETQDLYSGTASGLEYDVHGSRLRLLGGSTNHWGGWCRPLDPDDFAARSWIAHSGWPFDRDRLEPFYRRAQEILDLGPFHYDIDWWSRRLPDTTPLLQTDSLTTSVFQVGPGIQFGTRYRPDLRAARNVRVLLHSNSVNLRVEGGRIAGVDVATLPGTRFAVDARLVVVAAGGIENARLLLASRDVFPNGIGNDRDLVGRFFMDHATFTAGRVVLADHAPDVALHTSFLRPGVPFSDAGVPDSENARSVFGGLALTEAAARRLRTPRFVSGFRLAVPDPEAVGPIDEEEVQHYLRGVGGTPTQSARARTASSAPDDVKHLAVFVTGEPTPNPASRVVLGTDLDELQMPRVDLHWALDDADWSTLDGAASVLARDLGRLGLGRVEAVPAPRGGLGYSSHHLGTTRMHEDPSQGVVDADCRVHGLANLYIAGSSVFPTAGYANPTLTIVALACRLADHVRSALR